jgi:membrane associated rhomboid family serine protease
MQLRITPAVKALLIAFFVTFLVEQTIDQFFGGNLISWLALVPGAFVLQFRFWQLFTYPFLHADVMHLFLNMMVLAFTGGELESIWGMKKFLRYFFVCTSGGGLLYIFMQIFIWQGSGIQTPMVGASGGIYGLLIAYGLLFAERQLLFMMVFPMKAKHFIWVLVGLELMTTVFSGRSGGGLGSTAHLGGMVTGFLYLWVPAWLKVRAKIQGRASTMGSSVSKIFSGKKPGNHLKLVVDNKNTKSPKIDADDKGPKTWH